MVMDGARRGQDAATAYGNGGGKILRPDPLLHGAPRRSYRPDLRADMAPDPTSSQEVIQGNSDNGQESDGEDPGDRRRGLAPFEDDPGNENEGENVPGRGKNERGDAPAVVQGFPPGGAFSLPGKLPGFPGFSLMEPPPTPYNTSLTRGGVPKWP